MKKTVLILFALLIVLSASGLAAEKLSVYNWGDYIDMDTIRQFEKETGIDVIYEVYETNEDMYARIANGKASYDVIFPSDYMVERMIRENRLTEINWDNIPNVKNIDPRFMSQSYDPENKYSVPYTWGTMGILYNADMVEETPTSWETLMDERYEDSIYMLNSPRDTLGIALIMCGYDLNSTNPDELEAAKQLLIRQKPLVQGYVVDEVKDKMIRGEAAVALVWSGDATYCMPENEDLNYVVPVEGSNIFFDAVCIPSNAKNVSAAEKFIDFLCRPDIAATNYEYVGYAIPNQAAIELMGEEEYNESPVNNPPQEILDKCQVFKYLGEDTKIYDQVWTEFISDF
ncbi:MAG: ABC transporter substrate-binding protein [Clostridia bacterium]|nr:ABC transporter substrate-binding protein [Clostridia bacterium]